MPFRLSRRTRAAMLAGLTVFVIARSADATPAVTTTTTMAAAVRCAQPISTGAMPTATDCLFILKAAVGIGFCVPACICDVNGDLSQTATDALSCLNIAIGALLPLACPCGDTTTTTTISDRSGACCTDSKRGRSCSITPRERCLGEYLGDSDDVVCSLEQLAMCNAQTTTTMLLTTTTTTTTTSVPPVSTTTTTLSVRRGPCCGDGQCSIVAIEDCGGVYLGDSVNLSCTRADRRACAATTTTTLP